MWSRPEVVGATIALAILVVVLLLFVWKVLREPSVNERFGRYGYRVFRSGSFVFEGSSYRCDDPDELDWTARQVLEEWFESENGERELLYSGHREHYHCVVFLPGYGAGEAWGR